MTAPASADTISPPMLAKSATMPLDYYIENDNYVFEQKIDGQRIMMLVTKGACWIYNRKGEYSNNKHLSINVHVVKSINSILLDAECLNDTLYVFDVLAINGEPKGHHPYCIRRAFLEGLFKANLITVRNKAEQNSLVKLVTSVSTPEAKKCLADTILNLGGEGVMIKHREGTYTRGARTKAWLKYKFTETADVVVRGVFREGKDQAIDIGLYLDGNLVDSGGCKIPVELIGKLNIGDVIECKYLYATKDHKLYQPSFIRVRKDKSSDECTTEQLKYVNKTIV